MKILRPGTSPFIFGRLSDERSAFEQIFLVLRQQATDGQTLPPARLRHDHRTVCRGRGLFGVALSEERHTLRPGPGDLRRVGLLDQGYAGRDFEIAGQCFVY